MPEKNFNIDADLSTMASTLNENKVIQMANDKHRKISPKTKMKNELEQKERPKIIKKKI